MNSDRVDGVIAGYEPGPHHLVTVLLELCRPYRVELLVGVVDLRLDKLVIVHKPHSGCHTPAISPRLLKDIVRKVMETEKKGT